MHDIKFIRENPEKFDAALARRGIAPMSAKILELDKEVRSRFQILETIQARRNSIAKEIGIVKSKGGDASELMKEADGIKNKIAALEKADEENAVVKELRLIPNLLADDVPEGKDESANKEIIKWGEPRKLDFKPKSHDELGEKLGYMDFEQTVKISGARFTTLKGPLARLERALANFMLDIHTSAGFVETVAPHLVKDDALYGTGQLPKFSDDLFKTTTGHWLIPTSEVSLTNQVYDKILSAKELPLRMTSYSKCFRSEAGSAGKDTKGMIRQHEFAKVEMVVIAHPDKSADEHEMMLKQAEKVLQALELPYRVVVLCSGDIGFAAAKTYDLEVWLPSQNTYREISSVSNCRDFQARRMKARFKEDGGKETQFVHTLNGSGLAIGRTIVAILENYQQADGSIKIPDKLKGYMGNEEFIK